MSKEFALKERLCDGSAVDGNKPPVGPPAVLVDESGNLILTYTGFSQQKGGRVHLGYPGGQGQHLQHLLIGHNQFALATHPGLDALQFLEILVIQSPDLIKLLLQRADFVQIPVITDIEFNLTAAIKYRRAGHMCTAPCAIEGLHNGVWLFGLCYDSTAGFGNQMVFHQLLHRHPH